MSDAIVRWRNPYISTVVELIELLPKLEMTKEQARSFVKAKSQYDFYKTPYQLASQLGLYYEANGRYFPKFKFEPTENEILSYLENWIIHYCVPNPYTNGFNGLDSFSIHSKLSRKLLEVRAPLNYDDVLFEIFGEVIGNKDILKNSISKYSPIICIEKGIVRLKENKTYQELEEFIEVDVSKDRENKEYFFDLFPIPNNQENNDQTQQNLDLVLDINQQEMELINQVENLPNLTQTEKKQIISARIGQGYFRRALILECGFCPITQVDMTTLLIASHIKPWRDSDNIERINPKNGILLSPTYDKLFDKGYISFTKDKRLLVSNIISDENKQKLNLVHNTLYPLLPIVGREDFLAYHRHEKFLG